MHGLSLKLTNRKYARQIGSWNPKDRGEHKKSLKLTKGDAFFPAKKVLCFTSTGLKGWSASTDSMPADVSQLDQLP